MGISLVTWSPIPGCGKSVFTFLLTCRLSQILKKDTSILACCTCMQDGDIIGMINDEKGYPSLEDLVNAGVPSAYTDANIKSLLYKSGNIFFIDSSKATSIFVKKNANGYLSLMTYLKQQFDVVVTDTSSPANTLAQLALKNCDHVLNVTIQDVQLLQKNLSENPKDLAHIINRYDSIYPNKKELSKLIKTKNIFALPYCSKLQEMKNHQQLYRYAELDTDYMKAISKLAEFLVKTLSLPKEERKKNKSFIQLLKKGDKQ